MPTFRIVIKRRDGTLDRRTESATALDDLKLQLSTRQELLVYSELVTSWSPRALHAQNKKSARFNLLLFCRELESLLNAGLPLLEALLILSERTGKDGQHEIVSALVARLTEGHGFGQALRDFPERFPPLFVALMSASENTGRLPEALGRYVTYQETWQQLKSRLVGAMIYPGILLSIGMLVMSFLLIYLAPKFSVVYQQIRAERSFSTELMIQWGAFVQSHQSEIVLAFLALVCTLAAALRHPQTRSTVIGLASRLRVLSRVLHTSHCSQFYRSLALLLRGGNNLVLSIELSRSVMPPQYELALTAAIGNIRQGMPLSTAFDQNNLTTDIAYRMIRSGEGTGNVAHMLDQIAQFHEREIAEHIDRVTRFIEPVIMLFMGTLIGSIVISMYLPIFEIAGQL